MESCKFRNHLVGPKTYRMRHPVFVPRYDWMDNLLIEEHLSSYDWVLWIDADVLFVDLTAPLTALIEEAPQADVFF